MALRFRIVRGTLWSCLTTALVTCLIAAPSLASQPVIQSIGFTSSPRGHVLVPVSIDGGKPLVFVLDTGAGKTVVTPSLADRLGLPMAPAESETTLGTHGQTENSVVELHELAVGDARVADVRAVALDLDHITRGEWHVDGVLGMDFLQKFDVRLDFGASSLSFYPTASERSDCAACPRDVAGIAFETIDPAFIVLPASVGEAQVTAVLDTGAGHSGVNGKAAAALGVTLPPTPAGAPVGHGFGLQTGPVRIGDSTLAEQTTLHVMDHPVMAALGLAARPAMLIGTDQLAGRRVTICYGLGRLFLE